MAEQFKATFETLVEDEARPRNLKQGVPTRIRGQPDRAINHPEGAWEAQKIPLSHRWLASEEKK